MPSDFSLFDNLFYYDQNTGNLIRKISCKNQLAGTIITTHSNTGYIQVRVNYKIYRVHRIAWLLTTGEWPVNEIDHINGIRDDNRWVNLREVTRQENCYNRKLRTDNFSKFKGVQYIEKTKKFHARIKNNNKVYHLGIFLTAEKAHEAYCVKAKELFGEYWREV